MNMAAAPVQRRVELRIPPLADYQRDAFFGPHRFLVCEASTKVGKTYCCLVWQLKLWTATDGEGGIHWWVAPSHASARMAYERAVRWLQPLIKQGLVRKRDQGPRRLTWVPTGAVWEFHTGENHDALYGNEVDSLVLDEASRCREETWNVLESVIGPRLAPVRMIGNVKNKVNWNYHLARAVEADEQLPEDERQFPGWHYAKMTIWDAVSAGIFRREEAERKRSQMLRQGRRAIWLRDYEADCEGTGTGYTGDELRLAVMAPQIESGVFVIGVDPGGRRHPAGIVVALVGHRDGAPAMDIRHAEHWWGNPTQFSARVFEVIDQYGCAKATTDQYMPLLVGQLVEKLGVANVDSRPGTAKRRKRWYDQSKDMLQDGTLRIGPQFSALLNDMGEVALDSDDPEAILLPEYEVPHFDEATGQATTRVVHCDAFDAFIRLMELVGGNAGTTGVAWWV